MILVTGGTGFVGAANGKGVRVSNLLDEYKRLTGQAFSSYTEPRTA